MFRSDLVSQVFSVHIKKVIQEINRYDYQVGGLALAAVAVCGSLSPLCKSIHDLFT